MGRGGKMSNLLLFLSCWVVWFPMTETITHFRLAPILGEQMDMMDAEASRASDSNASGLSTKDPVNRHNRREPEDRSPMPPGEFLGTRPSEPMDEVERIEPRQWSSRDSTENSLGLPRGLFNVTTLAQRNPTSQRQLKYPVVTVPPPTSTAEEAFCDFGSQPTTAFCEWQNGPGALEWTSGSGTNANWLGGPSVDATNSGSSEGGYGFVETSQIPTKEQVLQSAGGVLHSPQLGSTGVVGTCFMFKYAMDGLSTAGLRVLLHVGYDEFSLKKENREDTSAENITATAACCEQDIREERVIYNAMYYVLGVWQQAQILYTFPRVHSLVIEALPVDATDPSRLNRGYIAIDDIDLQPGTSCVGFCNFASGFCEWINDPEDDFDWTITRGSGIPTTGPTSDSSTDRAMAGGYAFINSNYPRRPGDVARLMSPNFPQSNPDLPMCMHFYFHMFGSGIGTLKIYLRHASSSDAPFEEIWSLSGNAGNAWFRSEVTISSLDEFAVIFEASVGSTGMGDIAIDDISLTSGACPCLPQVAAPTQRDCTFEIDECEWINSRDPDRVDWERVATQTLIARNHRKLYSNGNTVNRRNEYYLGLGRSRGGPRTVGSGTAQFISREVKGSENPLCISFWYLMFESFIDATGPSLGILRIGVVPLGESPSSAKPIWQLYNNQGPTWNYAQANINEKKDFNVIVEGIWGPNRANGNIGIDDITFYTGNCTVRPLSASVRPGDCSFERGLCGWENITSSGGDRSVTWQRAFLTHRPAQLLDKTYGSTGDFVFFDIFTTSQKIRQVELRSPTIRPIEGEDMACFSFWFAAFGVEESTTLKVRRIPVEADPEGSPTSESPEMLWALTAKGYNSPRPSWIPGQVTLDARGPYRLVLEGSGSNGGFAIDDVKFQPNACPIRPAAAQIMSPASNDA